MLGFLKRATFAEGYGSDFIMKNDNEMLGLKEMSEQEVEEVVRSQAQETLTQRRSVGIPCARCESSCVGPQVGSSHSSPGLAD